MMLALEKQSKRASKGVGVAACIATLERICGRRKIGRTRQPGYVRVTIYVHVAEAIDASSRSHTAVIVKLDPTGSGLVFSSYLGGSGGFTSSTDFPITKHAVQPQYGGGNSDAFVTKITTPNDDRPRAVQQYSVSHEETLTVWIWLFRAHIHSSVLNAFGETC